MQASELINVLLIPIVVLGVAIVMMLAETLQTGRRWPKVAGWWWRAILLNGVQVGTVLLSGVAWDHWMLRHRPWNLESLGTPAGAVIGYLL